MSEIMECPNCIHMERTVAGGYMCNDPGPWCHYVSTSASPSPDYPALLARCKPWLEELRLRLVMIPMSSDDLADINALLADLEKAGV